MYLRAFNLIPMIAFHRLLYPAIFTTLLVTFSACSSRKNLPVKQTVNTGISGLRYINTYVLPHKIIFKKTTVGGLSSIDYNPDEDLYYMISDDRSHLNPARFYTAKIRIGAAGITQVTINGTAALHQKDGKTYPALYVGSKTTTDPEAMRYNRINHQLVWSSEGDRVIKTGDTTLIDPTITMISTSGKYTDSIPLPGNLRMRLTDEGPRRNGVLEGLTFADDFKSLYVNLEEPLLQDGPRADLRRNGAFVRIYKFDLKTQKNVAQYAYELGPVTLPFTKKDADLGNGIPDILWLGNDRLLVTERSYSGGVGTNVKVFLADLRGADDISLVKSLRESPPVHPAAKKLLLNMDELGIYIDNIEGATFGPMLPNGHQSILFVADDNFKDKEQSQFMLFEVIP